MHFQHLRHAKLTDNCLEARKAENKAKNRYRNVLPCKLTVLKYSLRLCALEQNFERIVLNCTSLCSSADITDYIYLRVKYSEVFQNPVTNCFHNFKSLQVVQFERKAATATLISENYE